MSSITPPASISSFTEPMGNVKILSDPHLDYGIQVLSPSAVPMHRSQRTELFCTRAWQFKSTSVYGPRPVVVKRVRYPLVRTDEFNRKLTLFSHVFFKLNHANIAPILGFDITEPVYSIVSPLFTAGDVDQFLTANPDTDRLPLVIGVASGIEYFHAMGISHGHIYPGNILIDSAGRPRISDPLIDHFLRDCSGEERVFSKGWSYQPPEALMPLHRTDAQPTEAGDAYAFAGVIYKMCAGDLPLMNVRHQGVEYVVHHGHLALLRPITEINSMLWRIMQKCWSVDPRERPPMSAVRSACQRLKNVK